MTFGVTEFSLSTPVVESLDDGGLTGLTVSASAVLVAWGLPAVKSPCILSFAIHSHSSGSLLNCGVSPLL